MLFRTNQGTRAWAVLPPPLCPRTQPADPPNRRDTQNPAHGPPLPLRPQPPPPTPQNPIGKLACIWGGFGFKKRQMQKHMDIYAEHGFQTHPIFSSIRELTTPKIGEERGKRFAEELQVRGGSCCCCNLQHQGPFYDMNF